MTTTMTSDTEQKLLELVANAVGFEYMAYVPTSLAHCSGHFCKLEHARTSDWNPHVNDRELLRFAVAAPLVNMHRIIDSASSSDQQNLEIRCAYIGKSFVHGVAKAVAVSPSGRGSHGIFETRAAGECQE